MAIPRDPQVIPYTGIIVSSPSSPHGVHNFRSADNFNRIVVGLEQLAIDHSNLIGNVAYIKEWWEDPAIAGENEEFPCMYILPLYIPPHRRPEYVKADDDKIYSTVPYIGDPLSMSTMPVTVMTYYKYTDIRHPIKDVRDWAWNYWDILSQEKAMYALPGGIKMMTPRIGWYMSGTSYIILWWSLQIQISAIL
mgnify:FL=1